MFPLIALLIPVTIAGLSYQLLRWVNPTNVRSFKTWAYKGGDNWLSPVLEFPVWVAHPAVIALSDCWRG